MFKTLLSKGILNSGFSSTVNNTLLKNFASTQRLFSFKYASRVLMVEPTNFFFNEESFEDNKLMNKSHLDQEESTKIAI